MVEVRAQEARLLGLLEIAADARSVQSFAELFDSIRDAEVLGPDAEGFVWLSGATPDGEELRTVNLGRPEEPLARAGLRWRETRTATRH